MLTLHPCRRRVYEQPCSQNDISVGPFTVEDTLKGSIVMQALLADRRSRASGLAEMTCPEMLGQLCNLLFFQRKYEHRQSRRVEVASNFFQLSRRYFCLEHCTGQRNNRAIRYAQQSDATLSSGFVGDHPRASLSREKRRARASWHARSLGNVNTICAYAAEQGHVRSQQYPGPFILLGRIGASPWHILPPNDLPAGVCHPSGIRD